MKQTIQEVSQDVLKLHAFLDTLPHGASMNYHDIQRATGVLLDANGKAKLRRALKRAQREYSCIHGTGIRLADAESCMPILSNRIRKIDRTVRRADKSQKLLQQQFFASLSADDQRKILFAGAVFGAIRLAAEQGKQLHGKPKLTSASVHIPLPTM